MITPPPPRGWVFSLKAEQKTILFITDLYLDYVLPTVLLKSFSMSENSSSSERIIPKMVENKLNFNTTGDKNYDMILERVKIGQAI